MESRARHTQKNSHETKRNEMKISTPHKTHRMPRGPLSMVRPLHISPDRRHLVHIQAVMGCRRFLPVWTLLLLQLAAASASKVTSNSIENSTRTATSGRSGRKDYVSFSQPDEYPPQSVFYSPGSDDDEDGEPGPGFRPSQVDRLSKEEVATPPPTYHEEYYRPPPRPPRPNPRYYAPGPMYKSGSSVNWNVWKGDPTDNAPAPPAPAPQTDKGGPPPDFADYYVPADAWKGDPWTPDQMATMMMMMNQMQAASKPKFGGFLSKLAQDPGMVLVAAILPFTLLLAAVMPTLVNMMMNGGLPTITTTATGNNNNGARGLEGAEFLSPLLTTITTFGARAFDNPDCMQRIFCQVTKGPATNGTDARSFQKSIYSASTFVDSSWLETFGVKTLFDAMADGDCSKIPCSHSRGSKASARKDGKKT